MIATLRTNWLILRTSIEERLAYRADFAFATLIRLLPLVTQVFLWGAIYGAFEESADPNRQLNGYTYPEMVAYYLLVMVSRAFSSMPGLSSGIAREVRDGTVKKYLTQPIDMLGYLFWCRVAHKLVYYVMAIGPFALMFYLFRDYLPGWPDGHVLAAFLFALALSFFVGFLIESLIGLAAFWYLEVSSLIFVYMLINYFLSGHMLPIDWLPPPIAEVVGYLPFKYLAFFPAAILLGRYDGAELAFELQMQVFWVIVLLAANRFVFARGVRRYSAFGG